MSFLTAIGLLAMTCSLGELDERLHDEINVTTEGIVVDVVPDEIDVKYSILLLKDGSTTLPVFYRGGLERDDFQDARVRVSGVYHRLVSGFRRFSGPFIDADTNRLTIVVPPPDDRFDAPTIDPSNFVTPRDLAQMDRRTVQGRVLAVWSGCHALIKTGDSVVNATFDSEAKLPRLGSTVKIVGYPETNLFFLNLAKADAREIKPPQPDAEKPLAMTAAQILTAKEENPRIESSLHGRLIRLSGIVRSLPGIGSPEQRLYLDSGRYRVPIDLSACPSAARDLTLGCTVEATGRCVMETEANNTYSVFPQIKGFAVVLRSADDLRVTSHSPWWTPRRLTTVIGALVLLLVGVQIRSRIIKRIGELKIGERTRLAVELHDSLSQTLAGVACQIAASDNAISAENVVAKTRIKTAERMLKSCRTELRHCLFDLRSDTLAEKDFAVALRRTVDQLEGKANVEIRFNVPRALLDDAIAHTILAVVRELTGNALRHGGATRIRIVGVREGAFVRFSVSDNGCGFNPATCAGTREGHFGLEGIRDRMKKLGGSFSIDSNPGKGTKAILSLPLTANVK